MNIQIDSNWANRIGNSILRDIEELNDYIKQLNNMIDNINEAWESDVAMEYVNIMREKNIPKLQELCEVLEKYGQFLQKAPQAYEILDEIFYSKTMEF